MAGQLQDDKDLKLKIGLQRIVEHPYLINISKDQLFSPKHSCYHVSQGVAPLHLLSFLCLRSFAPT